MPDTTHIPKVSIILPVYNGQEFLDAALESLVKQTYQDFELLVINDGSQDESAACIQRWVEKDSRIQLIQNGDPHGLPHALNRGLKETRGEYIARSDQDDIHRPERLEKEVAFLDAHSEIMLLGSAYQPFNAETQRQPIVHPTTAPFIAWKMLALSAFCHPSVMFRRAVYTELGGYPVEASEDFAYFSTIVRRWPTANLPDVFVDYREHSTNYSITRKTAMAQSVQKTYLANMQHYGINPSSAIIFYDFLIRRKLPFNSVSKVQQMAKKIVQQIGETCHLPTTDSDMQMLSKHVKKEIRTVAVRSLMGLKPIGEPLTI